MLDRALLTPSSALTTMLTVESSSHRTGTSVSACGMLFISFRALS